MSLLLDRSRPAAANATYACMFTFHRAARPAEWAALPNRNFYLNLDYLARLLSYLIKDGWEIVTVETMVDRLSRREGTGRLVNFSVDNCYVDTFEHVVPLFRRFGVPVTIYVTTGIPDGTDVLAWSGLETILSERDSILLDGRQIDVCTGKEKRRWFAQIAATWDKGNFDQAYLNFCRENDADAAQLRNAHAITWDMLAALRDDPLVEIGAHTISHPEFSSLPPADALKELAGSGARLRSQLGVPCRHFAFPYGRSVDCGERDFALAREAGFASAATTVRGLVRPNHDRFSLRRNNINGGFQSIAYAKTTLSGLSGVVARMLNHV